MMALAPQPREFEACADCETDFGGGKGCTSSCAASTRRIITTGMKGYVLVWDRRTWGL